MGKVAQKLCKKKKKNTDFVLLVSLIAVLAYTKVTDSKYWIETMVPSIKFCKLVCDVFVCSAPSCVCVVGVVFYR